MSSTSSQEDPAWVQSFERRPPHSEDDKETEEDAPVSKTANQHKKKKAHSDSSEWIPSDSECEEQYVVSDEIQAFLPKKTAKKSGPNAPRRKTKKAPRTALPLTAASSLDKEICLLQTSGESSLDFSGDVGVIGRVKVDVEEDEEDNTIDESAFLDLKGILFDALPYVCNTACVVSMGANEAKITNVFNSVVHLIANVDDDDIDLDMHMDMTKEQKGEDGKTKAGTKKKKGKKRKTANKRKTKKGK